MLFCEDRQTMRVWPDLLNRMTGSLTSMQHRIWVGQQMMPDVPLYNTTWRFLLRTAIDPKVFEAAFRSVASRCDALRIVVEGENPALRVLPECAGSHRFHQLEDSGDLDALISNIAQQPFDITKETCRSALIRVGSDHWIWVLSQHHIVNDAASGPVIFKALSEAHESLVAGGAGVFEPLPSFLDYATSETTRLNPADIAYWDSVAGSGRSSAALYGIALSGRMTEAREHTVQLDTSRLALLSKLTSDPCFGALTPIQSSRGVLQTALYAWLARVSGAGAITVGIATHGRLTPASRSMAGCLIDIFPLRVDIKTEDTFRVLHHRIRTASLEALRHAVPGTNQVDSPDGVDAVLNAFPLDFGAFGGLKPDVEWLENTCTDPHHPVRLNVIEEGDGRVTLRFLFNREILKETTVEQATRHYLAILDACLRNPEQRIDQVDLTLPNEQSRALTVAPIAAPAGETDLLDAFAKQVAEGPDQVAILDGERSVSRRELDARSNAVASALRDMELGSDALVGVHLRRSPDLIATLLGVLKSGHAFVPLDPGQAPLRLDAIAEEARLSALVSERAVNRDWSRPVPTIDVGDLPAEAAPLQNVADGRAAYVLFTSGSTGQPKGVVVGRPALSRYAHWANRAFVEGRPSTWALHSSIGFDLTMTSIFAPLVSGGVIKPYVDPISAADLSILRVFTDDTCDVVKLTPRHLALVLQSGARPTRIRSLVLGGEGLATSLARDTKRIFGREVQIFNEYGPTEATVGCMVHRFDPAADTDSAVPIGRPAEATRIYVCDAGLNPVPDGVQGTLYIGGIDRLADGYLRRPQETSAVFVPDPFNPGSMMYRSGDLASVRADGTILYHGREDDQLKLGSVRIEQGEIEAAMLAIPEVSECAISYDGWTRGEARHCNRCGISEDTPGADLDEDGVCTICEEYQRVEPEAQSYFRELEDLRVQVASAASCTKSQYDCIMLLSGGKDSTYALCRLAELTPRVLCLTLDNGYISEGAKANITSVTETLGLDHRFMTTPAMNRIFVDSLKRHANVCNGCFKTVYTLALHVARDEGIPLIVTGLSRGQLFETRLTNDLFGKTGTGAAEIDRMVVEARRSYHQFPDEASRSLNGNLFETGDVLSDVEIVDFYRYCDVPVSEIYRYLKERIDWTRPADTGRSSNCLINDAGIYVHKAKRNYHNYALPYSWDVRMGHKTIEEARAELDDEIDEARVRAILEEIGYNDHLSDPEEQIAELVCYYVGTETSPSTLRSKLRQRLPREALPAHFVRLDKIPLNANGKVDSDSLPTPIRRPAPQPELLQKGDSDPETRLLEIFRHYLNVPELTGDDNFYDVGGTSITALQIATRASSEGFTISAADIFTAQSVNGLEAALRASGPIPTHRAEMVQVIEKDKQRIAALLGKRRGD